MTEAAFRPIYEQHRDPLYRFAYRLTGSPDVAEDLVHDCFVGLFRGGYDEARGSLKTYLYGAMRNLCRKHYRDTGRESLLEDRESSQPGPLDALISIEISHAVKRAVEALPFSQRETLILFEYQDLSLDEISKVTEVELAAVKSRLHRARESLRKSLAIGEAAR